MKPWLAILACLVVPVWAQGSVEAARALKPKQSGYAVRHSTVLVHQVLFGRAHGVALLAAACDTDTPVGIETRNAYAKWHDVQIHAIAKMSHDLARWYFTSEAQLATDADIVRALKLEPRLDPNLTAVELKAACATFAEMLRGEHYDLATLMAKFTVDAAAPGKIPKRVPSVTVR